jgi:hypothetical protein
MSGRGYRVIKRMPWIEGGRPAPPGLGTLWEGGKDVIYEPGDTVYMEDQDLESMYRYLEGIDDAGRAALEEARAKAKAPARRIAVESFDTEQHSSLAWALARTKVAQGEGLKEALLWAIRNGASLPDDYESRNWIADALEGKHTPKRGKGRPRKQPSRTSWIQAIVEHGIVEVYDKWLAAFQRDRELAWLRFEAQRIWQEQPDAAVWRRRNDLGTEEGRQSFETALTVLGALPYPSVARGAEPARELALRATVQERGAVWESTTGKSLTPSVVARLVTRAKKSE